MKQLVWNQTGDSSPDVVSCVLSSSGKKLKWVLQALDVIPECLCPQSGFADIPALTCSLSSHREGPTAGEQGLPAGAAGRQAVSAALPAR